ncbi:MAG: glycosyltransferase [Balneolaceae bacterium]
MASTPLLSVLLTTHTQPAYLEQLLESLLTFQSPSLEIIVVNDAADSPVTRSIEELFKTYPHQRSFLFDHPKSQGRSVCLNEALLHSQGSLIWAPLRADRLNEELLTEAVKRISADPAAFWTLDCTLPGPEDVDRWMEAADEGFLPDDSRFVWNRSAIPSDQLYFQPNMHQYIGCELAIRLTQNRSCHSTDAFFVVPRRETPPADFHTKQELLLCFLRSATDLGIRSSVLNKLDSLEVQQSPVQPEPQDEIEWVRELKEKDPRKALDMISKYLKHHPDHEEAIRLKIFLLEKLRRHVEAAELKHSLQKTGGSTQAPSQSQADLFSISVPASGPENKSGPGSRPESQTGADSDGPFTPDDCILSIVIPTTGDGKPALEKAVVRLSETCDPHQMELIVIDNASIDDTFDYLRQLENDNLLNIHVITNKQNRGFGPSVNQGLEESKGEFVLIMHNDLVPENDCIPEMLRIMEENKYIGVLGPVLDRCDQPEQTAEYLEDREEDPDQDFIKVDSIDSSCMMLRKSTGVSFDDSYGPAFYEDMDLCNQLAQKGYYSAIATRAQAGHRHRLTTEGMGLYIEPDLEWRNAEIYMNKWKGVQEISEPDPSNPIDSLMKMELPKNPLHPTGDWLQQVTGLLSDETRTEILQNEWEEDFLFKLVAILLIADQREFLRTLENRLDDLSLPVPLLKSFIRYYYKRNIYSRCRHYIKRAEKNDDSFFDLYRLRIAVAEKEGEKAVTLLNRLMKKYPCHPELYKLTGDVHRMDGNEGEAKSFYALANQLDPGYFSVNEEVFEIKF